VEIINCDKPIFSIAGQLEVIKKIPRDTKLFWSPNFIIPILNKGKVLATVHDVFHLAMSEYLSKSVQVSARAFYWILRRRADKIICVSHFTARELIRFIKIPDEKIQVIYNGVDRSWFDVRPKGNPYDKPYLLFVGNVKLHKNLSALLKAFSTLKDKIDHDLVIVGRREGFLTPDHNLENAINNYNLHERVHFTGYIEDDLLKQYYVFADALVFPSLYEGFGLPPLEAMACGCPAVVSNAASLPEVCGNAALYFNPYKPKDIADKILLLLNNDNLRVDLTKKGKEHARQYNWEKTAQETFRVIEGLW
jgi:glycosyltransferase involved in cell wall biosynthesis